MFDWRSDKAILVNHRAADNDMINTTYPIFGFHHTRIAGSQKSDYVCVVAHSGEMEHGTAVLAAATTTTSSSSSASTCIYNAYIIIIMCVVRMSISTNKI